MPTITITLTNLDTQLSDSLSKTINTNKSYKYSYLKVLKSRLALVKDEIKDLPEEEQLSAIKSVLITERNIAAFAADSYAMINEEAIAIDFSDIVEELDKLLKE
jgi:hypothetical protein